MLINNRGPPPVYAWDLVPKLVRVFDDIEAAFPHGMWRRGLPAGDLAIYDNISAELGVLVSVMCAGQDVTSVVVSGMKAGTILESFDRHTHGDLHALTQVYVETINRIICEQVIES